MVAWPAMPSAGLALLVAVCSVYTATAEGQTAGLAVSSSEPWKPWSEDLTTPRESKAGKPSECDEVKSCSPSTSCPEKFVPAPSTDWVACCFDGVTDCIPGALVASFPSQPLWLWPAARAVCLGLLHFSPHTPHPPHTHVPRRARHKRQV